MRLSFVGASLLALAAPVQANAQIVNVPYGETPPPVPVTNTPPDPRDTPEEIARDAARDLRGNRFYNKPGATRAQYDADWQECRLIARGSRTPSGTIPVYFDPAVVSPVAAGVGGMLGGLLVGAIVEGEQRRTNRQSCLLIKGWRMVTVPAGEARRINAMTEAERSAHFDKIVGATEVSGTISSRDTFFVPPHPDINFDAPLPGPGSVFTGRKVDPAIPIVLGENEAALVVTFRRPASPLSTGRPASFNLARYDVKTRDLIYQPRDWKKTGDMTTYGLAVASNRKVSHEVHVYRVTAGDYVLTTGLALGSSNCFGAPMIHLEAGEVAYMGDFMPIVGLRIEGTKTKIFDMAYASKIDEARAVLAAKQPALAATLKPAQLRNRATYACSAMYMNRWDLPGVEELAPLTPTEPAAATATPVAAR